MHKVHVSLHKESDESYDILIGRGVLKNIPAYLKKHGLGDRYAIICDSNVAGLFGKPLLKRLASAGMAASLFSFPAGEKSKSLAMLGKLQGRMLDKGFNRKSAVIALGGGVAGDLAGFVAATFMRGIPYIQVPTTLLAMVDSSIGGKTAINLPLGKNSCGAFHQPKAVFADVNCLKALPVSEMRNGLAEVVKYAMIADRKMFAFLEKNTKAILGRNISVLEKVVKRNCEIKAGIVEQDEKEGNLRKVLNYGHTVGHAIEALGNYHRFSHGQAVALGMQAEAILSHELGFLSQQAVEKQDRLLLSFGLVSGFPNFSPLKLVAVMKRDKKSSAGKIMFALPCAVGKMKSVKGSYGIEANEKTLRMVLAGLQ